MVGKDLVRTFVQKSYIMPWPADEIAKEARAVEVTGKQAVRAKRLGHRAKCDARRWPCVVRTSRGQ